MAAHPTELDSSCQLSSADGGRLRQLLPLLAATWPSLCIVTAAVNASRLAGATWQRLPEGAQQGLKGAGAAADVGGGKAAVGGGVQHHGLDIGVRSL